MTIKTTPRNTLGRLAMAVLSGIVLSGCAGLPASGPEDTVSARAQARWDAVVAGDWEKAYGYATPTYRATVDLYRFRVNNDALIKFRNASVFGVACEDSAVCKVKMKVTFTPPQDRPSPDLTTVIEERWVIEGGEWWRYTEY